MERYKIADEKIVSGYDYLERGNSQKACDMWLEAWDDIKSIMSSIGIDNIDKLQQKYQWSEFLSNYVQDLEAELHNAGLENKEYFRKRIKYCEEMLAVCGDEDDLIIENTRRAIADSILNLAMRKSAIACIACGWGQTQTGAGDILVGQTAITSEKTRRKHILEKQKQSLQRPWNKRIFGTGWMSLRERWKSIKLLETMRRSQS